MGIRRMRSLLVARVLCHLLSTKPGWAGTRYGGIGDDEPGPRDCCMNRGCRRRWDDTCRAGTMYGTGMPVGSIASLLLSRASVSSAFFFFCTPVCYVSRQSKSCQMIGCRPLVLLSKSSTSITIYHNNVINKFLPCFLRFCFLSQDMPAPADDWQRRPIKDIPSVGTDYSEGNLRRQAPPPLGLTGFSTQCHLLLLAKCVASASFFLFWNLFQHSAIQEEQEGGGTIAGHHCRDGF